MAIRSLVLAIMGGVMFVLFLTGSLIAFLIGLVIGVRAVFNTMRKPHIYGGRAVATIGIVLNSLGLIAVAIITAITIPGIVGARIAQNEVGALEQVRKLATAEAMYQSARKRGEFAGSSLPIFGSMGELSAHGLISRIAMEKGGYQFKIRLLNLKGNVVPAGDSEAVRFEAVATPDVYGLTGKRSFYTSEIFIIRWADRKGKEANSHDLVLAPDYQYRLRTKSGSALRTHDSLNLSIQAAGNAYLQTRPAAAILRTARSQNQRLRTRRV